MPARANDAPPWMFTARRSKNGSDEARGPRSEKRGDIVVRQNSTGRNAVDDVKDAPGELVASGRDPVQSVSAAKVSP
jgi:hypothetical protein